MVELKKVKISKQEKEYDNNWCSRCDQYYCENCVDFYEVDFDIRENIHEEKPWIKKDFVDLKGERVCPWCYNQLIEKKLKEEKNNE